MHRRRFPRLASGIAAGVGAPLTFSAERHLDLDSVHFTHIDGGRWVPVTDLTMAVRA